MNILLEQLLMSEFTFGFELEAYVDPYKIPLKNNEKWENIKHFPTNKVITYIDKPSLFKNLEYFFKNNFFGINSNLTVEEDNSLKYNGFEMQSPVFNLTPLNISQCIKFLSSLNKNEYKIYTDNSCGFHTHFAFPEITPEDIYWIECHLALDNQMKEILSSITTEDNITINFITEKYSSDEYLDDLKNAILNDNFEEIAYIMSEEKMRLLRNHPQGTIEWRGPRNFLNKQNVNDIKTFFMKIYTFAKWISEILDKKEINGYDKQTFLNLINEFHPQYKKTFKKSSKIEKIIDKIINKPSSLLYANFSLHDTIDIIDKLFKKLGAEKFNSFIMNFATREIPSKVLTGILMVDPTFFRYSIQHQSLPIKELNIINPFYIADIFEQNKKYISLNDIKDIIENGELTYLTIFPILSEISKKLHKNIFTKKILSAISLKYNVPYNEVVQDAQEFIIEFH